MGAQLCYVCDGVFDVGGMQVLGDCGVWCASGGVGGVEMLMYLRRRNAPEIG